MIVVSFFFKTIWCALSIFEIRTRTINNQQKN